MVSSKADRYTRSLLDPPTLRTARVATVALLSPIDKPYSYIIPETLLDRVQPGVRVNVPVGRRDRPTPAFCLSISEMPWRSTLKDIIDVIDEAPMFNEPLLELGRWIARYYAAPLGRTLDLMIPAAAKRGAGRRRVKYVTLLGKSNTTPTDTTTVEAITDSQNNRLSVKQRTVLEVLHASGERMTVEALCTTANCTSAVLNTLAKKELLSIETVYEQVDPFESDIERHEPSFELNEDQQRAVDQIHAAVASREFSVQVLFGVTGSGKTEVYVSTIRRVIAEGRQAIMLVPEIALTTQTVRRLQQRFDRVAVIHSGLSDVQRARTWAAIRSGDIPVVIGTRSAVFAPCPNLGVIIVDEEAEPSYKSQAAPRYHTRDVAVKRGQIEACPIVLGSATPSLETWNNVQHRKHYHLIHLPRRVRGLPLPELHLVDMRDEHRERQGVHLLSREMETYLARTFERHEQAVLLLNRRGYANFLHCPKCRTPVICPHCSVHMVFHADTQMAHCHYCGTKIPVPQRCPASGCDGKLVKFGIGVERVEEEFQRKFPGVRSRRIDSDVMATAEDYADVLLGFEQKKFDCLIGTQMIAKGLDFPFVSFVGVVSADTALSIDDFRGEERTFQLVLQVAGRSGRGETPGHVVVQTFAADTTSIQHAVAGNYEGFARVELENRRQNNLPPYWRMVRIILADKQMTKLRSEAEGMTENIKTLLSKRGIPHNVLGPRLAAIPRMRDKYRYDVLLTFPTGSTLTSAIDLFKDEHTLRARVASLVVDVDPVSLQ